MTCQRRRKASENELGQRTSRISTAGSRSHSAQTPNATTGRALAIPAPWWSESWPPAPARGEWLEQVPTFGGVSQLPPATLQEILAGIGAAIDALGGSFTMHYTTVAVTAARTSASDPA